jgi:hypothetical protein
MTDGSFFVLSPDCPNQPITSFPFYNFSIHPSHVGSQGYRCQQSTEKNERQYCRCDPGERMDYIQSQHMNNGWFERNNEDRTWNIGCRKIKIANNDIVEFDNARQERKSGYRSMSSFQLQKFPKTFSYLSGLSMCTLHSDAFSTILVSLE